MHAQRSLWLSATGSTARPPADVVGATTSTYLLFGLQGSMSGRRWDSEGSLSYGDGLQPQAGRWFWADASSTRTWARRHATTRLSGTLAGLRYTAPFSYGAYTAQMDPSLSWQATSSTALTVAPSATGGIWSASGATGGIGVVGSTLSLAQTIGGATAQLSAELHHASNGSVDGNFRGAGFDLAFTRGAIAMGGNVKAWHTPLGNEWGYGAYASATLSSSLRLDVQLARSVLDPVLATPGSFGASVALSWRIAHGREKGTPQPLYIVGSSTDQGAHVRFTLTVASASTVAVSGSFTGWNPVPMQRDGKKFTLDLLVPRGWHQFGFLVDGQTWYLPPDAPGVVSDDFGRKNATLVI